MDPTQILSQILASAGLSSSLPSNIDLSAGNILRALVILVAVYILARVVRGFLTRSLKRLKFDPRLETFLIQVSFYGIIALGIIWVLGGFGLSIVVLGIAAGFALKDLIENFAAGLLIMGTRPFQPGDWIIVEKSEGRVAEVGWRGTLIDGFDGRRFIVPNSNIVKNVVINNSIQPRLRNSFAIGVDVRNDFAQMETLILNALGTVEGISNEPGPSVFIESMNGTAMNLGVYFWVVDAPKEYKRVSSAAFRAVKEALTQGGIEMTAPPIAPIPPVFMSQEGGA